MIKLGVIGYGYWGPNIVRNFLGHQDCEVVAVCDKNSAALARVLGRHPGVRVTTEVDDIVTSPEIDAVAIVTPCRALRAGQALENGKYVSSKPLRRPPQSGGTRRTGRSQESADHGGPHLTGGSEDQATHR